MPLSSLWPVRSCDRENMYLSCDHYYHTKSTAYGTQYLGTAVQLYGSICGTTGLSSTRRGWVSLCVNVPTGLRGWERPM